MVEVADVQNEPISGEHPNAYAGNEAVAGFGSDGPASEPAERICDHYVGSLQGESDDEDCSGVGCVEGPGSKVAFYLSG